ncbi:MAG: membrane integrity-associated transporter subunit PqiC [Desulfobacteraceae bacterium]|nr:membrane integrity-associated transporter subunit PqiC [Desulfobacteraceae bacterium]
MTRKCLDLLVFFIILIQGLIIGCIGGSSQEAVYYVFNSSAHQLTTKSTIGDGGLGVGPIKIPEFLKRPQIVMRQSENVLVINEFHRWADSLEAQTTGVLVENLSTLLNTSSVSAYPWERPFVPKYQLYIDFRRFEGKIVGLVVLEAVWWVVETKDNKLLLTRRSSLMIPMDGRDYKTYVTALNTALEKLCQEIAGGITHYFK